MLVLHWKDHTLVTKMYFTFLCCFLQTSSLLNDEVLRKMEQKINELLTELRKKDRTLKQLNALLSWKQTDVAGSITDGKEQDQCSLSDEEYIV